MAIVDELTQAVTTALSEGAAAARGQGVALKKDFEDFVRPQLDDIAAQAAAITEDYVEGNIGKEQAQDDLVTQMHRIKPLVLAESELALLAVQVVINSVVDALTSAVNTAAKMPLL